ncbi:hypothetical protein FRC02_010265 [Tulasnella sp. 418]|nr:hypothetical protein FRC02_010265 [Tulasnella sp. 418]
MAGFTTVRDLGTEGAEDADVDLRKCISNPMAIIPGPRLFITNRAIVSSGSYGPKGNLRPNSEGVDGKTGGQVADGEAECIRVVRNQIGAGVDWIKIYADYPFRSRLSSVSPKQARKDLPLFSEKELKAMIDTAHSLGVKVAAHTLESSTIRTLIPLGIDSIEHGLLMDEDTLKLLRDTNGRTTWVPTLAVCTPVGPMPRLFEQASRTFANALKIGNIKIACGGDTGTFPHGHNALEMLTMIRLGDDWKEVLRKGTLGGWECIRGMDWEGEKGISRLASFQKAASKSVDPEHGETDETAFREIGEWPLGDNDVPLGALKPGFAADIIAISGEFSSQHNVLETLGEFGPKVMFVMKGGKIYKMNGVELPNPH